MRLSGNPMGVLGITIATTTMTVLFLRDLLKVPPKPSPEEALGKALGKYLEAGIKVRVGDEKKGKD